MIGAVDLLHEQEAVALVGHHKKEVPKNTISIDSRLGKKFQNQYRPFFILRTTRVWTTKTFLSRWRYAKGQIIPVFNTLDLLLQIIAAMKFH